MAAGTKSQTNAAKFLDVKRGQMKVLICMDPSGGFQVVTDKPAQVIVVSEHTPHDRLFRLEDSHTVSAEAVAEILGSNEIGSKHDERHKAVENRILAGLDGKQHLKPVK